MLHIKPSENTNFHTKQDDRTQKRKRKIYRNCLGGPEIF